MLLTSLPVAGPFFDMSDIVYTGDSPGEQGFLAMEFHPDFATNNLFYVYYTIQ